MARLTLFSFLFLFGFQSFSQTKKSEPYSLSSRNLEYDSLSLEEIISDPNAHKISDGVYLISDLAETSELNSSQLCYRKTNTTWYRIYLEYNQVELDSSNLDFAGRMELVLKCHHCEYGSGGGDCQGAFIVLNIDDTPIELMNAINYTSEEMYSRTYGDDTIPVQGYSVEYERKIALENNSIIVFPNDLGAINQFLEDSGGEEIELTQIPSGTYRLIDGRLRRVKK